MYNKFKDVDYNKVVDDLTEDEVKDLNYSVEKEDIDFQVLDRNNFKPGDQIDYTEAVKNLNDEELREINENLEEILEEKKGYTRKFLEDYK